MGLRDSAMLVDLSIGSWGGYLSDADATQVATRYHGADEKSGNFSKKLFKPGALAAIGSVVSSARAYHLAHTLPWNAFRLLLAEDFIEYTQVMRGKKAELEEAVDKFIENYPYHKEEAKRWLGGLYKEENYPGPAKVRKKFYLNVEVMNIPSEADVRLDATEEEKREWIERIKEQERNNTADAVRECWKRMAEVVQPLHEKLQSDDPKLRKGMVEKMSAVAASLKRWQHLVDDPELNKVIESIENNLVGYDEETLNVNPFVRDDAKAQTKSIMDAMPDWA